MTGKQTKQKLFFFFFAFVLGMATGWGESSAFLLHAAEIISQVVLRTLKLIGLPMIFFSIISVIGGMPERSLLKKLGKRTLFYTLFTTLLAAMLSLLVFLLIRPHSLSIPSLDSIALPPEKVESGYLAHLFRIVPSNIVELFYENNVLGVLLLAVGIGFSLFSLAEKEKNVLLSFFSGSFSLILQISRYLTFFIPLFIWAFAHLFARQLQHQSLGFASNYLWKALALYLLCIVLSNFIHAIVTLPFLLIVHRCSPRKVFGAMMPALSLAFFSSSSNVALPLTMKCAKDHLQLSSRTTNFVFPLCATINMNACATFILTTVLFVSMQHGITYTAIDLAGWVGIATLAAVANAGIPQGCYFLATALLTAMDVPLQLMGMILPFYAFIDMAETAINVWSDSCIATIVDKKAQFH